jgi:histidinol-phosphatase (PHP family)
MPCEGRAQSLLMLPADGHVHSEWSWDAPGGSMERTCARAVAIGLTAVAFTEHADYTPWTVLDRGPHADEHLAALATPEGLVTPPELAVAGYLECIEQCRDRFPDLRILSGVELGEPHWHGATVWALLRSGQFDRVLGSLHCLPSGQQFSEVPALYRDREASEVYREYLIEIPRLIEGSDAFSVLAHIDYPLRYWPAGDGPIDPGAFQEEFRHALRVLADSGRALEINTAGPMCQEIVAWWCDEGGTAITFGSDAHEPETLARRFQDAAAMAAAAGFRPGSDPCDPWPRAQERWTSTLLASTAAEGWQGRGAMGFRLGWRRPVNRGRKRCGRGRPRPSRR